jgi:plasmid stability protein
MMDKKSDNDRHLFIRDLPPGVKQRFKSACALRGVSMSQEARDLIARWVDEQECPKKVQAKLP